jgi:hypothetical protein
MCGEIIGCDPTIGNINTEMKTILHFGDPDDSKVKNKC